MASSLSREWSIQFEMLKKKIQYQRVSANSGQLFSSEEVFQIIFPINSPLFVMKTYKCSNKILLNENHFFSWKESLPLWPCLTRNCRPWKHHHYNMKCMPKLLCDFKWTLNYLSKYTIRIDRLHLFVTITRIYE